MERISELTEHAETERERESEHAERERERERERECRLNHQLLTLLTSREHELAMRS
jgi:hypothetical protein